jgi:hypothetical protein
MTKGGVAHTTAASRIVCWAPDATACMEKDARRARDGGLLIIAWRACRAWEPLFRAAVPPASYLEYTLYMASRARWREMRGTPGAPTAF